MGRRNRQRQNHADERYQRLESELTAIKEMITGITTGAITSTRVYNVEESTSSSPQVSTPNVTVQTTSRESNLFKFEDIESSIPKFSGKDGEQNIGKWLTDFEETADTLGFSDLQKIVYAKRLIVGTAKSAINAAGLVKDWLSLKGILLNEFKSSQNSAEVHIKMSKRKKRPDESFIDYFYVMRELGRNATIEDDAIIMYIIKGIQDSEFNKAVLYGAKSLNDFKEKLKTYSGIREEMARKNESRRQDHKSNQQSSKPRTNDRCYNCGIRGHPAKDCRRKEVGPKCFSCFGFGHKASECSSKKMDSNQKKDIVYVKEIKNSNDMSKIIKINDVVVVAYLDTGSDLSFVREDQYIRLGRPRLSNPVQFQGVGSGEIRTLGSFTAKITIDGYDFEELFHVAPQQVFPKEVVIGKTLLGQLSVKITPREIQIEPFEESTLTCLQISVSELDVSHIKDHDIAKRIMKIVNGYQPRHTKPPPTEMTIVLSDETPIWQNPRRLSPAENEIVREQIDEWIKNDIVQESTSDFASPIVLVNKKDGSKRICVDYRLLNKVVVKDRYPLPLIDDNIDRLSKAKIFSTLDLRNGFFHVPIVTECRKYTAFVTPFGHFEFKKAPFGLCTSPAVFQRYVNKIFDPLIRQGKALTYVDDLVIPAKSEIEAVKNLEEVLDVAAQFGLEIKWEKCQLLQRSISYLGYEIEQGSVKPSIDKITAVGRFPEPKNLKQVQSFLGLSGYFRRFIANYSTIARPLTELLKKNCTFEFGHTQRAAFNEIKTKLCAKPVLMIYQTGAETEVHTDASKLGYGAILLQKCPEDFQWHPVYFYSKKTTKAEQNYTSYELEVLAVVNALKKFRVYLIGIPFKIVTDCSAFKGTIAKKDISPRIARWVLQLEEFSYQLEHRPGTSMKHVDALSRLPSMMLINETLLTRIQAAQQKDETTKAITEVLKHADYDDYVLERNILFKHKDGEKLLYIPRAMQAEVIKSVHEQGHFGLRKMEELVSRDFFIPKCKEKIMTCIRNCVRCILASKEGKKEGFLHPIPKEMLPLQTYHIDHLGPMTATSKGYKYIFAVMDAFTKFVWLYPTQTLSTSEVLKKLKQQQTVFGNPERIITDKGPAFTSALFQDYCKSENIECVQITTGVPRGNGQIERIHRVVISILTKLAMDKPTEWYKFIDRVQRCINNSISRSTGATPFELLFGTKMRNAADARLGEMIKKELVEAFNEERDALREEAARQIATIQAENRRSYNQKRREATKYKVGDIVAIRRTQFGSGLKISPKFLGPYQVTKAKGNERYDVIKIGTSEGPKLTSTSADNMQLFAHFDSDGDEDDESDIEESSSYPNPDESCEDSP